MFLGTYGIDEYVNIPAATHRFSSGAAYAPTAISYSIYEEGSDTGLDEDVDMTPASPFDSVTGAYLVRRQLTAAAGFEAGKTYCVLIKATVDSVAAIDWHIFQVRPIQTGDAYARLGAPAGASVSADIAAVKSETADILTDTAEIGAAGAGLSAVPWNALWDAEVESEATDALNAYDPPTKAELDTAVANVSVDEIQATALADLFNTDSGTNYASAAAGSVVKEIADNAGGSELSAEAIADAVWDEAATGHTEAGKAGAQLWTDVDAILADTDELQQELADGGRTDLLIDAVKAVTDKLDTALELDGAVYRLTENALEQAPSGTTTAPTVEEIRAEMDANSTKLANLDATVSSRLATSGYTAPPSAVAVRQELDANSTKLANLDAAVSTRLATSGYTTPPTVTQIRQEMDANSTKLANVDATVSSRASQASVDAVDNYVDTEVGAIKAVTDKLDTVLELDGAVYRLTENALELAPSGSLSAPTVEEIRAEMDANSAKLANLDATVSSRASQTTLNTLDDYVDTEVAAIKAVTDKLDTTLEASGDDYRFTSGALANSPSSSLGAGAISWTYTVTDSSTSLPLADVDVWVTTDSAGTNVIASGKTNQNGQITFMLDAGTVYVWSQKSGYDFTNPDTEVVS